MSSFKDRFPDTAIIAILGDDVLHIKYAGGSEVLRGAFEFQTLEEELGNTLDIIYPTFQCTDAVASAIKKRSKIKYDGKIYSILKRHPIDTGMTIFILAE